jgi:cysteinyl-tRNA synthetase
MREFDAALRDDLDTPRALRALRRATREGDATAARRMLGILVGTASLK